MSDSRDIGHHIASKAGMQIVRAGRDAGLDWKEIAIACESAVAIVIATVVEMGAGRADPVQFATELVDTLTERAQQRVVALVRGVPFNG